MADNVACPGEDNRESGFAPKDLTDNRAPGDWRSRYEAAAWRYIWLEAAYLALLLLLVVAAICLVWLNRPQRRLGLSVTAGLTFSRYGLAWLSGTLGGVLFAMKWLYHTVAKQMWNLDRRLWRFLIPHISGGLAFATVAVIQSLGVFDPELVSTAAKTTGLGFLVGFFSDNALAKLADIAENLLGPSRRLMKPDSKGTKPVRDSQGQSNRP